MQLPQWLQYINAHVVDTPRNGACFYYAIWGAKMPRSKRTITKKGIDLKEGNFWKIAVTATLATYFSEWITIGLIDAREWMDRKRLGRSDTNPLEPAREYLLRTQNKSVGQTYQYAQWAGSVEILAAAVALQEPLLLLHTSANQPVLFYLYCPEYRSIPTGADGVYVSQRTLKAAEAARIVKTYLAHSVIPLLIRLDLDGNHYQAIRFADGHYEHWSDSKVLHPMRQRLYLASAKLNLPVFPAADLRCPSPEPLDPQRQLDFDYTGDSDDSDSDFESTRPPILTVRQHLDSLHTLSHRSLKTVRVMHHHNQLAYAMLRFKPPVIQLINPHSGCLPVRITALWQHLKFHPVPLAFIVRHLPYPEEFMARRSPEALRLFGMAVLVAGKAKLLLQLCEQDHNLELQRYAHGWRTELMNATPAERQYLIATDAQHHAKLQAIHLDHYPLYPGNHDPALITACAIVLTRIFPDSYRHAALETRGRLCWTTFTVKPLNLLWELLTTQLRDGDWHELEWLFGQVPSLKESTHDESA